ncbi:MAG: hypothetical protein ACH34U_03730 [Cyanobium sp.]
MHKGTSGGTFYMRVRGHRLRSWGVHDGDLLLIDRSRSTVQ